MGKPTIRFKGYTDDWEQRKLGDYLEVSKEKNRDALFEKEDVLSVSGEFGIVNQIEFQGRSFAGVSVANYGVVEVEDVVYTKSPLKSNPYGIIKTNKGKSGIVSTLYAVYKPKNNVDSEFVQIYFELDSRMNSYMHPLVNKGAKNDMKVSDENALKGPVIFPSIEEQKAVSQYFDKLNCLITLHQRKCDQAKILKKYMLQKMFPQNDEKVPKIRFKSFTDDWEQRKLGEISSLITKGTTPKDKSGTGEVNFIKVENIDDFSGEIIGMSKISLEEHQGYLKRSQLQEGDILFSIAGTLGRVTSVKKGILPANTNQALSIIRLKEDNLEYVKTCLKGNVVADFIKRNPTIGAQPNLSLEQVSTLEIGMPSEAEQERIGLYFSNLDRLITLHQHKCEELKNIKKFMLQNMFVQEK